MKSLIIVLSLLAFIQCGFCQQLANDTIHRDPDYNQTEPTIAAMRDSTGAIHLVASFKQQIGDVEIARAHSDDTGKTWQYDSIVPPFFGAGNDPSIAYGPNGYAYLSFISDSGRNLERSTDWGKDWATTGAQGPSIGNDATVIATDRDPGSSYYGNIYFAWDHALCSGCDALVAFCRSTDNGATYDTTTTFLNHNGQHGGALPQLCISKGGTVNVISGGGDSAVFNYSTDAGTTWNYGTGGMTGKKLFNYGMNQDNLPGILVGNFSHKFFSIACLPTSDTVYFAYESGNAIKFGYTDDNGNSFHGNTQVSIPGLTVCEPWIAVDQNDNLCIAYYGETDTITSVYVAVSTDHGAIWSTKTQYVVSNTYSANDDFSQNGVGDYLSIAALDPAHIYVLFSDKRSGNYQVYFAALDATDVQYRNALGGVYNARHLVLDASGVNDTVPSLAMEHYSSSGSHTAQPDSGKYHNVVTTHGWNFLFQNWNQSTNTIDSTFVHSFSVTANALGTQEADFANIDTLRVTNNCDGLIDHGTAELQPPISGWISGTSPVYIDTALRANSYSVKTDSNVITIGSLHFKFEAWANGDTNLTNGSTYSTTSDTNVQAYFHANMRADAALYWNNQRKLAYDSISSSHRRYWFTYISHGNVYLSRSTDQTAVPAGCTWDTARMVNSLSRFGHCANSSIAWLPGQGVLNSYPAPRVIVVWEDTSVSGGAVNRTVKYSIYDTSGSVNTSGTLGSTIQSNTPCAPMVCDIMPNDLNKYYGDAVVVWADGQKDSLFIAVVNPASGIRGGPVYVPESAGGQFPAVEPGYNRPDTAISDPVDFELTWHDSTGIKYDYLVLSLLTDGLSNGHIFDYKTVTGHPEQVIDTSWWGTNEHASLAVGTNAEPILAWEQIGARMIPTNCVPSPGTACLKFYFIGRMGITLRSKVRHDSSWGGFLSIVKFSTYPLSAGIINNSAESNICGAVESFFAPSVTVYKDDPNYCRVYWTHGDIPGACGGDSVKLRRLQLSSLSGGGAIPDTTIAMANGRTPAQPYSQFARGIQSRVIWAQDTATTEIMKRDQSCNVADNYVATGMKDYNQALVHWNDTANFSFMSGEYTMIDSAGSSNTIHQQPLSPVVAIHSINDAANQMRSQYFHIKNDTVRLLFYNGVVLTDTTSSLKALDSTRAVTFKVELRDSSTGNLLQTLAQIGITGNFTSTTLPLGMDTIKVTGRSGKTCYMRLTVDTANAPSTFSLTPSQVYSENSLSAVIASDTGALGKELMHSTPPVVPTASALLMDAYPNPFISAAHIFFTLSQSTSATVTLYDMMGREVKRIAENQYFPAGSNTVSFNAMDLPSGIYMCVFTAADARAEKLMILEK